MSAKPSIASSVYVTERNDATISGRLTTGAQRAIDGPPSADGLVFGGLTSTDVR